MKKAVANGGYGYICMDESKTRYGAVETIAEGEEYAKFLEENRGDYDGIILCLPNFGDENGAMTAFKNIDVPVLVHGRLVGFSEEIDLSEYGIHDIIWGRCDYARQYYADKYLVTGHTPTCNINSEYEGKIYREKNILLLIVV